jgi:hypothetical protein
MTAAMLVLINVTSIERILLIDALRSLSVFLFAIFTALLLLTNVFLRFRLHQRSIYRPHRLEVPSLWFMLNGQTALLLLLFIELSIILCFALATAGACLRVAQVIALIFLICGFLYVETNVRELSVRIKASRTPKLPDIPADSEQHDKT